MPQMTGRFATGKNKGRSWQVYADPASRTGYPRKQWDPNDPSGTEYFEPFDYSAAEMDEASAAEAAAAKAAKAAERAARQKADRDQESAFWQGVQRANERAYQEGVRQYDQGYQLERDEFNEGRRVSDRDFDEKRRVSDRDYKLNELDTRTRLQIALREVELSEKQFGASDMRARERNVMDYLTRIGDLRLPYTELQALSQRAVAGIIPGAAAPGAAGAGAGGGALTADQWQALATGVQRNYEQRQIGQGSALAG